MTAMNERERDRVIDMVDTIMLLFSGQPADLVQTTMGMLVACVIASQCQDQDKALVGLCQQVKNLLADEDFLLWVDANSVVIPSVSQEQH